MKYFLSKFYTIETCGCCWHVRVFGMHGVLGFGLKDASYYIQIGKQCIWLNNYQG